MRQKFKVKIYKDIVFMRKLGSKLALCVVGLNLNKQAVDMLQGTSLKNGKEERNLNQNQLVVTGSNQV